MVPQADIPKSAGDTEATVTGAGQVTPQPGRDVDGTGERVEYRDQDGNLLDEAEVSSLAAEGKISMETKYETKIKVVDQYGNPLEETDGVAPPHPDVEGQNPDTKGIPESLGNAQPTSADTSFVGSGPKEEDGKPKPGSEANEATGRGT